MAKLQLDGDASGAVRAVGDVSSAAQNLKGEFDKIAQSAADGVGPTSEFAGGLEEIGHHLAALVGPGALIAGAVAGIREYNDELQRGADLSKNFPSLAPLAQLGPGRTEAARQLLTTGVPDSSAAGIVQAMEGASPEDIAFIRAAAPTTMFRDLPAMETTARAYELSNGGNLASLIAQSAAASAGTGMNAEQMIAQINTLSTSFAGTGISGAAGQALAGEMGQLFPGQGTMRMQQFLQGGTTSGFFDYVPADVKQDPAKLLDYIRAQGTDDETLKSEFGGRGILTARAIVGAGDAVEQRFQRIQAAHEEDAYGMLSTAHQDIGLEAGLAQRAFEGRKLTRDELPGLLRDVYRQIGAEQAYDATESMSPLFGGPLRSGSRLSREVSLLIDPEFQVRQQVEQSVARGTIHSQELRGEAIQVLKSIDQNTRTNAPVPSGLQE